MSVFVDYCHEMFKSVGDYYRKMSRDSRLDNLDEVFTSFYRTQLHIAVISGDIKFVRSILSVRPDLALKKDKQGLTPLHLASARKSLQMVKSLLKAKPEACTDQDKDGNTPLHLAAMKDRVKIMEFLIDERPEAIQLKNGQNGETILHFCVRSNSSVETLELLVNKLALARISDPDAISLDSKDNDGNTVLHLAAEMRNMKIVNYLLHSNYIRMDIDAVNNNGLKALDILSEAERKDLEIGFDNYLGGPTKKLKDETLSKEKDHTEVNKKSPKKRYDTHRVNALLVVATLIGQIAFQAALNPPGGVRQDDTVIYSDTDPVRFGYYVRRMFRSVVTPSVNSYIGANLQLPDHSSSHMRNTSGWAGDSKKYGNVSYLINELVSSIPVSRRQDLILEDYTSATVSAYNNNSDGGGNSSFFPYLILYAGYPVMAYNNPYGYVIYNVVNTIAFAFSMTIVFAVICGFVHESSVAQNRILVMFVCISIGCISVSYFAVSETLRPYFFIYDRLPPLFRIYIGIGCLCGIGLLLWTLISRLFKLQKKHLTGYNYFKSLFSMDADAVAKLVLLVIGLFIFYVSWSSYIWYGIH